ncbi:hypothetical protein Ahy_B01g052671 [Arachis hypogaea]|uniref:Uncharacterized protein n=1 Tax=Arachis hypogaea TaxID=3818 RepID=A0A445AQ05_ARAHY|nr:hypothetical protein Ahy_B01g052671 [Arachis hypogaea]
MIRKIFNHRIVRRLQQIMEDVHERRDHITIWLHPNIKKVLYVHWEIDERFWHRCLMNRANRTLAKSSKYTGPITFTKTKTKLACNLFHFVIKFILSLKYNVIIT